MYTKPDTLGCLQEEELGKKVQCCAVLSLSVMSNSLRPHGLQPARLLCPWDFPGKSTGMGSSPPKRHVLRTPHTAWYVVVEF